SLSLCSTLMPVLPYTTLFRSYELAGVNGRTLRCQALAVGNPHVIVRTAAVARAPLQALGSALQAHAALPERVNVGCMQIMSRQRIRLRVYERCVGETLACGSGTAAAVVAGIASGDLDPAVEVELPGGRARVEWAGHGRAVYLTGPAQRVFDGELVLS